MKWFFDKNKSRFTVNETSDLRYRDSIEVLGSGNGKGLGSKWWKIEIFILVLTTEGKVICFGINNEGQCGTVSINEFSCNFHWNFMEREILMLVCCQRIVEVLKKQQFKLLLVVNFILLLWVLLVFLFFLLSFYFN